MSQLNLIEPDQSELDQSLHGNSIVAHGPMAEAYFCPGQSHPINRSVHLARLISGFSECRNCVHKNEQGALPCHSVSEPVTERRTTQVSLVASNGVRGVYLNELGRAEAANWGAAFASIMWDEQPRFGRPITNQASLSSATTNEHSIEPTHLIDRESGSASADSNDAAAPIRALRSSNPPRRGPAVVIGFDERPSSPDIVVGVALGLRRMGCHVIDLGQTSNPCFHFAVHHLGAAGGMFVTGSGCDPAWTGFNLVGRHSIPWSLGSRLEALESRAIAKVDRPTRTAGSQRSFHATVPYEAGLWKFFHVLRPLQVVCGISTRQLPRTLASLFARLPCGLTLEHLPLRKRNLHDPNDADVRRVAASVANGRKHLGLIVDDDGERCAFMTEGGRLVSPAELSALLIDLELREHRSATILADQSLSAAIANWISTRATAVDLETVACSQLASTMMSREANLGFSANHRIWFRGDYPVCDAILTLARVLQALSFSDASMSEVLLRIAGNHK